MSARTLDIWCVLGRQRAAAGPQDASAPVLNLYSANTYALRLNALSPVLDPSSLDKFTAAKFAEFSSFEAALVVIDAPPVSGKWKLREAGAPTNHTAELEFNITPENLQTALNALTVVTAGGGVTVTAGNVANVFVVRTVDVDADFSFEEALNQFTPTTTIRIRKASDGGGTYSMIKLRQGWLAGADDFTFPDPPQVTCAIQRTGTTTANCIQLLVAPAAAMGLFELQYAGPSTTLMPVAGLTASIVESALNALFADGATSPRFRCFAAGAGVQVECIGPLEKQAVPALVVQMYGQVPSDFPMADFAVTPVPVELLVSGKDNVPVQLEIAAFTASGGEHTLMRQSATLYNTMLTKADHEAFAAVATRYVEVITGADPNQAAIIGFMSQPKVLNGFGDDPSAGSYNETFVHNLNVIDPIVCAWQLLDATGAGKWRLMQSSEFDARSDGNPNSVTVSFPFIMPVAGQVGSVRIRVINPDAQAALNAHRHADTEIDCTGANAGLTLAQVLAILAGAMPDGWPTVPGSALGAGSVDATRLNLASLISALFTPTGAGYAQTLGTVREIVKDPVLIASLVTTLTTNPALAATLTSLSQTVLTKINGTPEFAAAMQSTIASAPALATFFQSLILATLQDGAVLRDAVVFAVPDVSLSLPAEDAFEKDDAGFFALPKAFLGTPTDDGSIAGRLPKPNSALAGHYHTCSAPAWPPGRARDFATGTLVFCDGIQWLAGVLDTGKLFTTDLDVELFTLSVNADQLSLATRFSVLAGITLSQAGNCEGRWLLTLRRGTAGAESGPGNLSTITWDDTVISRAITLTEVAVTHNVGFAVERSAGDVLTATKTLYTATSAATAPAAASFILRATLTRYDAENVPAPAGLVKCSMKGVRASIVKL